MTGRCRIRHPGLDPGPAGRDFQYLTVNRISTGFNLQVKMEWTLTPIFKIIDRFVTVSSLSYIAILKKSLN